jgi:hypothetical protein
MLHLYALVRQPAVVPAVRGIEDRPLRTVVLDDGIEAVVSETSNGVARSEDVILAHAHVVEVLAEANEAVLPARFAGSIRSDDELRAGVAERREKILAALGRVDGCVELGLRVLRHEPTAEPSASSGREYMQRRLDQVGQAQALARDVHGTLAALARESTCQVVARGDLVLTSAYLLPRAGVEQFRAAMGEAEEAFPDVTLVLTGPWPPYSFTLLETGSE